jgi:hypothetical protein
VSGEQLAHDVETKAVEWLWMDRIPKGMISVVAGKPDQGKGLVCAHIAAAVSKRGGNVLYSAIEDDHGIMTRPRLEAAGADLKRVVLWRFGMPAQLDELRQIVMKNKVDLIVIDPFGAHLTSGVSRFSDSIRRVTTPLSKLAEESGTAVLVTEHALKKVQKDAHPLSAIGGNSSGLPAACRMGFIFGVDPDDDERRVLCNVKHNIRQEAPPLAFDTDVDEYPIVGEVPSLVMQGETTFDARRLLQIAGDGKPGRKPDKRATAAEWLTTHMAIQLAGKPVKAGVIFEDAKQYGFASKTVRRAAEDMGIVKNPPGGGRNCTWDLPADLKKAMGVSA